MDEIQTNFFTALNEMEKPQSCFLKADLTSPSFEIKLDYPRSKFISDIKKSLMTCAPETRAELEKKYGFKLTEKDTFDTIEGYPHVCAFGNEKLNGCINSFFQKNNIQPSADCPQHLTDWLNAITKAMPELLLLTGKRQHPTHNYTVDVHTLKVLQGAMADKRYSSLPDNDKTVLKLAILMHDLTKKEGEIDKTHPECASKDAEKILKRFDLTSEMKTQICLIIRNHDWLERYNKCITTAGEFAMLFKDGNNFLMECILAKADLQAVQRDGGFYEKFKGILAQGEHEISSIINSRISAA